MACVTTKTGVLEGFIEENGVSAWLGVPFAKPPVGGLRWKPAQRLEDSGEHVACLAMGPSAAQFLDEVEPASLHEQSEDCLYLNIWVKDPSKRNQPVMVYIHGGAYFSGGAADPLYYGANFAANHDVVLVSINYRLNVFGSLQLSVLPGGDEYPEAGYLAITDQMAALEWLLENVAQFGGDPDCITLFGESAGSASAALMAVTPRAKGLFKRAICESGPIQLYKTPENAAPYALEFAAIMGCKTVAELAQKTTGEILEGMQTLCDRHHFEVSLMFSPVCDGALIPRKPMRAWCEGAAADVDIMIGSTGDEFTYFKFYFKPEEMPDFWHGQTPFHFDDALDIADWEKAYKKAHPEKDFLENYTDFMNQTGFFVGADLMAEAQSRFNDTYNYLFKFKSRLEGMGSCHAIELPFVFDHLDVQTVVDHITGPNPPQHLADEMGEIWYSFAATGKPSCAGVPDWPCFSEEDHAYMVMDEDGWIVKRDINEKNLRLFAPMFDSLIKGDE